MAGPGVRLQGGFFAQLLGGGGGAELAELRDASREAAVRGSGRRHTIIRVQGVRDVPGGQASLRLLPSGAVADGGAGARGRRLVTRGEEGRRWLFWSPAR